MVAANPISVILIGREKMVLVGIFIPGFRRVAGHPAVAPGMLPAELTPRKRRSISVNLSGINAANGSMGCIYLPGSEIGNIGFIIIIIRNLGIRGADAGL
jgi:hypothetical protein